MGGFAIKVVDECPVTRGSRGVLSFDAATIAMIAGAVRDNIEWMAFLNGTRSEDGYEVVVEKLTIPTQKRSTGHVELATTMELAADVVGVIHSHHRMGAFFSNTDKNELNPRFPSSIVVAVANNNLGFDYKAEGKAKLPCGAVGRVEFAVHVRDVDQRFAATVVRGEHGDGLGDCTAYTTDQGDYLVKATAACGLTRTVDRPMVFGVGGGEEMLEVVRKQTVATPKYNYSGWKGGQSYTPKQGFQGQHSGRDNGNALGKKAKGRQGKNGLQKLDRPEPSGAFDQLADRNRKASERRVGCDECFETGTLTFHMQVQQWLCRDCCSWWDRYLSEGDWTGDDGEIANQMIRV